MAITMRNCKWAITIGHDNPLYSVLDYKGLKMVIAWLLEERGDEDNRYSTVSDALVCPHWARGALDWDLHGVKRRVRVCACMRCRWKYSID